MRTPTGKVLHIVATLDTAASLTEDAADRRARGDERGAIRASNAVDALFGTLHESPSIARLRAAVLLLDDVTDETIVAMTSRAHADLLRVLNAIDNGEV